MTFSAKDKRFNLLIADIFLIEIQKKITSAGKNETGGILIGNYTANYSMAVLKKLTGAPKDSQSGSTWFHRGLYGLQRLLNLSWRKKEYYLGEWHYHPFSSPTPSGQDIKQMKNIASSASYNCPEPLLLIVGGAPSNMQIKVFIATNRQEFFELEVLKDS